MMRKLDGVAMVKLVQNIDIWNQRKAFYTFSMTLFSFLLLTFKVGLSKW